MTTATRPDRPAVEEMYVVHRAFRTYLPRVAWHVRATPAGRVRRAAVVADHLRLLLHGLEVHHTGEDVELWPRLLERARPSAVLVATMQAQHETVHAGAEHVRSLAATWRAAPGAVEGEQLARAVESLCSSLFEHLDLEEREVLPLVEEHVTQAEWARLGESIRHGTGPRDLAVLVGMLIEVCDDAERRQMLAALPVPARLVAGSLGVRLHRRHMRRLNTL